MTLATVKLTGDKLYDPTLGGLNGSVELTLSSDYPDPVDGQLIKALPIRLTVTDGVMTPADFVVNDEISDTSTYTITQKFRGLPEHSYTTQLLSTDGPTVDISAKTPVVVDTTPLPGLTVTNVGTSGQILLSMGNFQAQWSDAAAASVSSVNGRQGIVVGLAEQSSLDTTNMNLGSLAASLGSAAFANTGTFDLSGAADNAQNNAESYSLSIVTAEQNRATAVEALKLPLAGGTMTGALAMGGHKITGGAAGVAATDFVIMSQITPDAIGAVGANWLDMLGLGLLTVPPTESGFTVNSVAGNMVCNLVTATKTKTIQTLGIQVTTAGVTGSGVNALALYTEAGVLIDQTGDMTTAMSSIGFAEGTMAASHQVVEGTNYYLCELSHFSGTVPKFAATGTASSANIPVLNGHYISVFKTGQATFPASFTPSTFSLNTGHYIMYGR